ncbi:hypothetical protein NQZ79_g3878 [Umbelopsis isabellina]|nr:hypothetical protein NQZ79_g3878 [Umbelopsis isabellina]
MLARSWAIAASRSCKCRNISRMHQHELPILQFKPPRIDRQLQRPCLSFVRSMSMAQPHNSTESSRDKKGQFETVIKTEQSSDIPVNSLITFLARRGAVHDALIHIVQSFSSGIRPPKEVLYQFFLACSRANDLSSALQVYTLLIQHLQNNELPLSRRTTKSLTYVFSMVINMVDKSQKSTDINLIWNVYYDAQRLNVPLNTVIYNTMLQALLKRQDHSQVHTVYKEMLDSGKQPSLYTYGMLMHSMSKQGDMAGFTKMLDIMQGRNMFPDFVGWSIIMHSLGRHGNSAGVERIYDFLIQSKVPINSRIINERLHAIICQKLTKTWTRSHRLNQLEKIWKEHFGVPPTSQDPIEYPKMKPDSASYTIMMKALSYDKPSKALSDIPKILQVMEQRGLQPGPLALIHYTSACLECKDTVKAKEAISLFQDRYDVLANEKTWRRVLGAMASLQDISGIFWALDALTESKYVNHAPTIDRSIPRKRPARYKNEIKVQDSHVRSPPTSFLNAVFVPKTQELLFTALLKPDTPTIERSATEFLNERVVMVWNKLSSSGVYIPLKIEQSIVVPGLLASGMHMHDIRQRIVRR